MTSRPLASRSNAGPGSSKLSERTPVWVVKLGGSLFGAEDLRRWLEVLAEPGPVGLVIVPGGGPFADAVRTSQQNLGFSDRAAHHMAILAMDQAALMLADLEPRLRCAEDDADLLRIAGVGRGVLWRPHRMTRDDSELAESWSVTADSLAGWLARRLNADALVLIKSAAVAEGPVDRLVADGVVDAAFADHLPPCPSGAWCVHGSAWQAFAAARANAQPCGARVLPRSANLAQARQSPL